MVSKIFQRFLKRVYARRGHKSFETFLISLGLFLILAEFFSLNANMRVCAGQPCFPLWVHYLIVFVGIGLAASGVFLLNPPQEQEWLVDWEK